MITKHAKLFLKSIGRLAFIYYVNAQFGDTAGLVTTCERYLLMFSSTVGNAIGKVYNRDLTSKKGIFRTNVHFSKYLSVLILFSSILFSTYFHQ